MPRSRNASLIDQKIAARNFVPFEDYREGAELPTEPLAWTGHQTCHLCPRPATVLVGEYGVCEECDTHGIREWLTAPVDFPEDLELLHARRTDPTARKGCPQCGGRIELRGRLHCCTSCPWVGRSVGIVHG